MVVTIVLRPRRIALLDTDLVWLYDAAMPPDGLDDKTIDAIQPKKLSEHKRRAKKVPEHLKGTRMAADIKGGKKPPVVPKNKSLGEILEMNPADPSLKGNPGRTRTTGDLTPDDFRSGRALPEDAMQNDKQKRANARRARGRKAEAVVSKAVEVLYDDPDTKGTTSKQRREGVFDEDMVIAEGILNLDDWDDEELIRGYRRNRAGRFGVAPKFIPKEVQQEVFRRIVSRGDAKMRAAYLTSIDRLTDLAENAGSEKVQLDAIRELMNRIVGKVPDRVHVAQEQPWEQFLADSIQPVGDEWEPIPSGEAVDRPKLPQGPGPNVSPPPSGDSYGGKAPTHGQE